MSRLAAVSVSSVRYDDAIPVQVRERLEEIANTINLVAKAFDGDAEKTLMWFRTRNPLVGDISPKDMIRLGRYERLRKFIINAMTERGPAPRARDRPRKVRPRRMPRVARRKLTMPQRGTGGLRGPIGVIELERFSEATLARWTEVSQDLDELNAELFFGTRPEQRRLRPQLIDAIEKAEPICLSEPNWVRFVTYQYSFSPLSAAGSLLAYGGRFNAGADLDAGTVEPWPCLYIAEDDEDDVCVSSSRLPLRPSRTA